MYTKSDLSENLKEIELLARYTQEDLNKLNEYIQKKVLDSQFLQISFQTELSISEYEKECSKIKLQDIYSSEMDSQTEELIARLKKINQIHNQQKESFEKISPIIFNYNDIAWGITGALNQMNALFDEGKELDESTIDKLLQATSEFMIRNRILPPKEDEDLEYLDIYVDIMMNIDNPIVLDFLNKLDDALADIDDNSNNYLESGLETFENKSIQVAEDYENLESILRTMKKNSKGF